MTKNLVILSPMEKAFERITLAINTIATTTTNSFFIFLLLLTLYRGRIKIYVISPYAIPIDVRRLHIELFTSRPKGQSSSEPLSLDVSYSGHHCLLLFTPSRATHNFSVFTNLIYGDIHKRQYQYFAIPYINRLLGSHGFPMQPWTHLRVTHLYFSNSPIRKLYTRWGTSPFHRRLLSGALKTSALSVLRNLRFWRRPSARLPSCCTCQKCRACPFGTLRD